MRGALFASAALHVGVLLAAILSLPRAAPFNTEPVVALPVELVTIAEETDVTLGATDAEEVIEDADAETVVAEAAPEPGAQAGATDDPAPSDTIATDADAIDSTEQSAAPEPAGEPEPEPEPVAETPEETEVAALPDPAEPFEAAEPEPSEEPAPQEAESAEAEEPAFTPANVVPRRRPTPPPQPVREARVEREVEDAFNADRVSQLINRTNPTGGGQGAATASLGAESGRLGAALTLSEMDALRSAMQRCWNLPIGVKAEEELVITVVLSLSPDGRVSEITSTQAQGVGAIYDVAADAARRAVLQCQPYDFLPPAKYDTWKNVQVNFDPRTLLQ